MSFGQFLINLAIAGIKNFNASSPGPIGGNTPGNVNASNLVVKSLGWSATGASPGDVFVQRDGTNALGQRNSINPQSYQIYNTYTDGSNYQNGGISFDTYGTFTVGNAAAGTGLTANMNLVSNGGTITYTLGGQIVYNMTQSSFAPNSNGTVDLGNSGSRRFRRLFLDYTNLTTGAAAATINKASGRITANGLTSSFVVTNSLVTANSHVFAVVSSNDGAAYIKNVTPAAGSFTITLGAASTGVCSIDFLVMSTDT